MVTQLLHFLVAGVIMGIFDGVWLGLIAKQFYRSQLGPLMLDKPRMLPALIFYALYVVGLLFFVINPALDKQSWLMVLGQGALFGLVAFATYDLTNYATLKDFRWKVALVDLAWGTGMTAAVTTLTFVVLRQFT